MGLAFLFFSFLAVASTNEPNKNFTKKDFNIFNDALFHFFVREGSLKSDTELYTGGGFLLLFPYGSGFSSTIQSKRHSHVL